MSPGAQTGLELTNPASTLSVEILGMHRHTLWRQHKSSGVALFLSVCLYLADWIKFSALHVLGKYFTTELSPQLSCVCKNALWGPNGLLSLPLVIILQDSAILGAFNCGTIGK